VGSDDKIKTKTQKSPTNKPILARKVRVNTQKNHFLTIMTLSLQVDDVYYLLKRNKQYGESCRSKIDDLLRKVDFYDCGYLFGPFKLDI
jgi:hypothetical protein